jgi:hypothetical protein
MEREAQRIMTVRCASASAEIVAAGGCAGSLVPCSSAPNGVP